MFNDKQILNWVTLESFQRDLGRERVMTAFRAQTLIDALRDSWGEVEKQKLEVETLQTKFLQLQTKYEVDLGAVNLENDSLQDDIKECRELTNTLEQKMSSLLQLNITIAEMIKTQNVIIADNQ